MPSHAHGRAIESAKPPVLDGQDQDGIVGHGQVAFDWRNGNARLSRIAIAPSARGRGQAAPMLTLILDEVFRFADMERVELNVYSFNSSALRAYERVGFKKEGLRRSSTRVSTERWDTVLMAILRNDWGGHVKPEDTMRTPD